jgi:Homeodomain-like domain
MVRTKPHKASQLPTYKTLSPEQENAIDLLILGKSDREVADTVGVTRETIWHWRHKHPIFIAELNCRRQALWAGAHERLRALVGRAVDVIEEAVGDGDLKTAIELLKAVKLYGEVGAPQGPSDPDVIIRQQAEAQVNREGVAKNALLAMAENLDTTAYRTRLAEVEAELRRAYLDK